MVLLVVATDSHCILFYKSKRREKWKNRPKQCGDRKNALHVLHRSLAVTYSAAPGKPTQAERKKLIAETSEWNIRIPDSDTKDFHITRKYKQKSMNWQHPCFMVRIAKYCGVQQDHHTNDPVLQYPPSINTINTPGAILTPLVLQRNIRLFMTKGESKMYKDYSVTEIL